MSNIMDKITTSSVFSEVSFFKGIKYPDERGIFEKPFYGKNLHKNFQEIREVIVSTSKSNVIRGLHFQSPPKEIKKLIYCIEGKIKDVFVDLRKNSSTYGLHDHVILSGDNDKSVLIPEGFAHGYSVLSASAKVLYIQSGDYSPDEDTGIHPLSLGIDWEIIKPIISIKDLSLPKLEEFKSPW